MVRKALPLICQASFQPMRVARPLSVADKITNHMYPLSTEHGAGNNTPRRHMIEIMRSLGILTLTLQALSQREIDFSKPKTPRNAMHDPPPFHAQTAPPDAAYINTDIQSQPAVVNT